MIRYIYDPEKQIVEFEGRSVVLYCGPELTDEAIFILDIYFGRLSPQDALIDRIGKCQYCKKGKHD